MKIVIRIFGLSVMLFYVILIFLQMLDYNIRRDELNQCISMAMTSTQIIMMENMEDQILKTNNCRKKITSNKEYLEEFAKNFYILLSTNTDYKIHVYAIDYTTGLLSIEIEGMFSTLNGAEKTLRSRKTSLIDVLNE